MYCCQTWITNGSVLCLNKLEQTFHKDVLLISFWILREDLQDFFISSMSWGKWLSSKIEVLNILCRYPHEHINYVLIRTLIKHLVILPVQVSSISNKPKFLMLGSGPWLGWLPWSMFTDWWDLWQVCVRWPQCSKRVGILECHTYYK